MPLDMHHNVPYQLTSLRHQARLCPHPNTRCAFWLAHSQKMKDNRELAVERAKAARAQEALEAQLVAAKLQMERNGVAVRTLEQPASQEQASSSSSGGGGGEPVQSSGGGGGRGAGGGDKEKAQEGLRTRK